MDKREGEPKIDTGKVGWMPTLLEIAVLGCHDGEGDVPQALSLTTQLPRQPPVCLEALAFPPPLHLASLGRQ